MVWLAQGREPLIAGVMSPQAHRLSLTVLGVLLMVTSGALIAMSWFTYINRWTYFTAVYLAKENGQDPYQVARLCADRLAGDFFTYGLVCGASVAVLAVAIIVLAWRHKT